MARISRASASVAAVTVLAVGAGGVAWADASTPARSTATSSHAAKTPAVGQSGSSARARVRRRLLGRALHGSLTVRAPHAPGHTVTLDLQRGTVTAVSPTSITIKSIDGVTNSYTVTKTTRVLSARKPVAESSITSGEKAMVVAVDSGSGTPTARAVRGVHQPRSNRS